MANVLAIHSVGNSIVTFLRNTYPAQAGGVDMPGCEFVLLSSGQLAGEIEEGTRIGLYLYRVTVNEHQRQARPSRASSEARAPLGLDLHFLLTAWGRTALDEQLPLAWAMRQLHQAPVLDASSLSPEAGWDRDEVVQIVPAELAVDEVMRIWDPLEPAYRLSVSYVARVVRLDPDEDDEAFAPVVARRLAMGVEEGA
jgi:hypothetical protein